MNPSASGNSHVPKNLALPHMILPEYLETVFYGDTPAGGWPPTFHILTAHNPKTIWQETENRAADESLRSLLERQEIRHFRITGSSADLTHQEASWAVVGLPPQRAIEIGRTYGQHALFEVLHGEVFVVSCDTSERKSLGQMQERLIAVPR
jgi:hypothetical protein